MLRKTIVENFPDQGSYNRYIEVFGGAGWVLFGKDKHAEMEIYNDINGELVNLFRVIKCHPDALQKELEWIMMSREQFFDSIQVVRGLTDIQRAARFWVAIKESFGSDCRSFGCRKRNLISAVGYLKMVSDRLNGVIIENVDFERLIRTYDRPDALFYLDPPYYNAEHYYPDRFQPEDHGRLKRSLDNIKGKFILSYNDCQAIRDLYKDYTIIGVERLDNLVTMTESRKYKELIIKNY